MWRRIILLLALRNKIRRNIFLWHIGRESINLSIPPTILLIVAGVVCSGLARCSSPTSTTKFKAEMNSISSSYSMIIPSKHHSQFRGLPNKLPSFINKNRNNNGLLLFSVGIWSKDYWKIWTGITGSVFSMIIAYFLVIFRQIDKNW